MQYTTYYHLKGRAEGRAEGRIEGRIEGKAEMVVNFYKRKFGVEPENLRSNLLKLSSEVLDDIMYALGSIKDPEHFLNLVEKELLKS